MLTLLAFALALGGLIVIHEYGHYRVAVACGVKVLRFSIGFGKPLLRWQRSPQSTEFVLCALPLGGYVRMLDERDGVVPESDRGRAFNNRPLRQRAAIVAAGPLANLITAALLYTAVAWMGQEQAVAQLSAPAPGSLAERAGLRSGQWVQAIRVGDGDLDEVSSFADLRWQLVQAALNEQDVQLEVLDRPLGSTQIHRLPLSQLQAREPDALMFERIGIEAPWSEPVMGEVVPGGPADRAGVRVGDRVLALNERAVPDAQTLRRWVRLGGQQRWDIERSGQRLTLTVLPEQSSSGEALSAAKVQAYIGSPVTTVWVRADALEGLIQGLSRTVEVSWMSVQMFGRMLVGEASLKNLSGPLTIADYAGQSASLGLTAYLLFVAMVSVSLGVLNLMPLPVLDGGHLMYYLWEAVTGRAVSLVWMDRMQRGGVVVLLALMSVALFNDVVRLLG